MKWMCGEIIDELIYHVILGLQKCCGGSFHGCLELFIMIPMPKMFIGDESSDFGLL